MKNKLFLLIIFLAFFLRFYKLGVVPMGLDWDEVSNSYNAYSILKTAGDEYGNFLPLANRSFDDYKPPLYMYLDTAAVAVFGLTPFAARLPSAVFGSITVITIYFLVKRLFEKEKIALVVMTLAAISPWLVNFSRVGFEANIGLFMTLASFTLLMYAMPLSKDAFSKNRRIIFIASAFFFGLSFYSYHSERIFVPLLLLGTIFIYWKEFLKIPKKFVAVFLTVIILLIIPFFALTPIKAISQRLEETSQNSTIQNIDKSIAFIKEDDKTSISKIIHNRRLIIGLDYLKNYMSHFDINYLFIRGDNNFRHHIENMGMLYLAQLPFLLYGIYIFIKERSKSMVFVLTWLLLSPIPAAPANVAPHAIRSLTMIVALEIIIGYAIVNIYNQFKWKKIYAATVALILCISFLVYLHNYYVHYAKDDASWWQYGYLQAVAKTEGIKDKYDRVIIDPSIEQAYAFWLFGTKYDPKAYQRTGNKDHFDKYYFVPSRTQTSKDLFVTAGGLPADFEILDSINFPNGEQNILIGRLK